MDWTEYENVRELTIDCVNKGSSISHLGPIARAHATLFKHKIRYPSCATSFLEMFFDLEREYKNQKGIK